MNFEVDSVSHFAGQAAVGFRVETRSNPESDDGHQGDGGQEVRGELVVAGCDASKVLEAAEGSFDPPALAVASFVVDDWGLPA